MNFHLIQNLVSTWCSQYYGIKTKVWGLARGTVLSLGCGIEDYLGPVAIQQTSQSALAPGRDGGDIVGDGCPYQGAPGEDSIQDRQLTLAGGQIGQTVHTVMFIESVRNTRGCIFGRDGLRRKGRSVEDVGEGAGRRARAYEGHGFRGGTVWPQ